MKIRDILREHITFTRDELFAQAEQSEFNIVYIAVLPNGDLVLDPEHHNRSRSSIDFTVLPLKKEIITRNGSYGMSVMPRVQQALRALMQAGIIDNTWKAETQRGPGYYDPVNRSKFINAPAPVDAQGLDAIVDKAIAFSPIAKNLVFYHGTSMLDWQRIQKVGLHPLNVGSNTMAGSESRGKHSLNDRVLYLAGSVDKALDYAKIRTAWQQRRLYGNEYNKTDETAPVVIAVQIPDPLRLVADDDSIIRIAQSVSRRLWKAKPPEERQAITDQIKIEKRWDRLDTSTAELLWREREGFAEIMRVFPQRAIRAWVASLTRNNQVGYRGIIPPKFLRLQLVSS